VRARAGVAKLQKEPAERVRDIDVDRLLYLSACAVRGVQNLGGYVARHHSDMTVLEALTEMSTEATRKLGREISWLLETRGVPYQLTDKGKGAIK
jgi:hypothetical protein